MALTEWERAIAELTDAYAPSTIANRRKDMSVFVGWCDARKLCPLPAAADTVAAYIEDIMPGCAIRTVQGRLAVIRWLHRYRQMPDPTQDDRVRLAFRRGLRAGSRRSRTALGLNAGVRDRLLAACPPTLIGLRDRAMIAVGYDTLCRRSELVKLRVEDVVSGPGGGGHVRIRRSKTDPLAKGAWAYISASGMQHLGAWLTAARLRHGPIFRPVHGRNVGEGELAPRIVNRTLRLVGEMAELEPAILDRLTAHSLRVGPAQDLAKAGRTPIEIMRAGRWSSLDGMMSYIREADINVWAG